MPNNYISSARSKLTVSLVLNIVFYIISVSFLLLIKSLFSQFNDYIREDIGELSDPKYRELLDLIDFLEGIFIFFIVISTICLIIYIVCYSLVLYNFSQGKYVISFYGIIMIISSYFIFSYISLITSGSLVGSANKTLAQLHSENEKNYYNNNFNNNNFNNNNFNYNNNYNNTDNNNQNNNGNQMV